MSATQETSQVFFSKPELADLLHCSERTVDRYDTEELLPASIVVGKNKRNRRKLWRRTDILAWQDMGCPTRKEFEERKTQE